MTSRKDPFFETRLLSRRNSLSIQEKEHVFESLLFQHSRREKKSILRPFFALSLKARVAWVFLAALLLMPLGIVLLKGERPQDEFHAKGQGVEVPFFSVSCFSPSGKTTCRQGAKLAFRLHPQNEDLYFAAFARREADGLILWYSPETETGESLFLQGLGKDGVLPKGLVLDEAFTPGKYQIFGILSHAPMGRREIKSLLDGPSGGKTKLVRISKVYFNLER